MIKPLYGVNLGGWLVLEPWMTPSLFADTAAIDECSFCLQPGARVRLKQFRDSFITEDDFAFLARQGVQAVRLPIGYWLFGDERPYVGTKQYVDKAFRWAHKHGLMVLLSLHGAPGSQNGEMHSGRAGDISWHTDPQNVTRTLEILERLAKEYGRHPALLGISVLNEPSPRIPTRLLQEFYYQAYALLKSFCRDDVWIVCSDAFRPGRWRTLFPPKLYPGLYFDYHHYQIFSWIDRWLPAGWQLWRTRHTFPHKLRRMARRHPLIVGEWSAALRGGLEYDQHEYYQAQLKTFAPVQACFYWSYKTEYGSAWSYKAMRTRGL